MADIITSIPWKDGNGNIEIKKVKDNTFSISSTTVNDNIEREQIITFQTTNTKGIKKSVTLKVIQKGLRELYIDTNGLIFMPQDSVSLNVLKSK